MPVRIDKWMWAVRIFRTRGLAAAACRNEEVTIAGMAVKPARDVKIGDVLMVKKDGRTLTFKVLQFLEKRLGAPLVKEYVEDQTPASEYEKPSEPRFNPIGYRPKGAGRPTKKERRDIDKIDR